MGVMFGNSRVDRRNRAAFEFCRDYVENWKVASHKNRSLFIKGGVGTGKTHLSAAVITHLTVAYRVTARYCSYYTFSHWQFEREFDPLPLITCPLLVLDDLGLRPSVWGTQTLLEIIVVRIAGDLPIMVTSPYDWDDIKRVLAAEYEGDPESRAFLKTRIDSTVGKLQEVAGDPLILKGKSRRTGRK